MNTKIILYILIGLVILSLIIATFFPEMIQAWRDSGKPEEDICKPGPGYTEESWREHMGHHPDIYKDCLS
mgnify:FL=1